MLYYLDQTQSLIIFPSTSELAKAVTLIYHKHVKKGALLAIDDETKIDPEGENT